MTQILSAPPLSVAGLVLCIAVAGYAWGLALYSLRPSLHVETLRFARRVTRLLITAAVLAVLSYVVGFIRLASEAAQADVERKTEVLAHGIERLLVRPIIGSLFAGLLALTLLRARASYLKPAEETRPK